MDVALASFKQGCESLEQSPLEPHIPAIPHIRHHWGTRSSVHKTHIDNTCVYLQELVHFSTIRMESALLLLNVRRKSRSVPPSISFPRKAYVSENMNNQYFYVHHCKVKNAICYMKHGRASSNHHA